MKIVLQRVRQASVSVGGKTIGEIKRGIAILFGITQKDEADEQNLVEQMVKKTIQMRIFEDANDKMNLSLLDIQGEILVIPNFTLYGDAKKGTRPSYTDAAEKPVAQKIYQHFLHDLREQYPYKVAEGAFGSEMELSLSCDGPVTIILEL